MAIVDHFLTFLIRSLEDMQESLRRRREAKKNRVNVRPKESPPVIEPEKKEIRYSHATAVKIEERPKPAIRPAVRITRDTPKPSPKKKQVTTKKQVAPKETLIGEITHYFSTIQVIVVQMNATLKLGDKIRIKGQVTDFLQKVQSLQVDNKPVEKALKGQAVGLKVTVPAQVGDQVFRVQ